MSTALATTRNWKKTHTHQEPKNLKTPFTKQLTFNTLI
jgi:hypothetical protein